MVEFHDTDQMIKAAIAFSTQEPPRGRRIGMITNTGGPGIQAVDEAVGQRARARHLVGRPGRAKLEESLYAEASLGNPVDVVATANADHYHAAVETLLDEDGTDMVLVFFVTAPFTDIDAIARRIKEATDASDKPVVVVVETYSEFYGLIDKLRAVGSAGLRVRRGRRAGPGRHGPLRRAAGPRGGGAARARRWIAARPRRSSADTRDGRLPAAGGRLRDPGGLRDPGARRCAC